MGSLTEVGCILLSQPIRRDSIVRFELSDKLPPRVISVINLDGSATEIFWDTTYTAQVPRLVPAFQTANGRRPLPLETYAVAIRQRQASYLGPGDIIMYQSDQLPVDDQYRVQVQFGLNDGEPQELKRVTIEPTEREAFYYSPSMQREDNVRLGNGAVLFDTVYGEIEQISLNPAAPAGIPLHFIGS